MAIMRSPLFKQTTLACFSPLVMLATFIFEILAGVYIVWRYKLSAVSRLAVLILIALATFQLAEYNICETALGLSSLDWARVGFVAITTLPPMGIHMAAAIAGQASRLKWLIASAYALGAVFATLFMTVGRGMQGGDECLGNYVIFHVSPATMDWYTLYYYSLLLVGVGLSVYLAKRTKQSSRRLALYWLAAGYMAFIIPTTTVSIIDPSTMAGIPSIMCGFAVLLAAVLVARVVPLSERKLRKR